MSAQAAALSPTATVLFVIQVTEKNNSVIWATVLFLEQKKITTELLMILIFGKFGGFQLHCALKATIEKVDLNLR